MKFSGQQLEGQDDFSHISRLMPTLERCQDCDYYSDQITHAFGLDLCPTCLTKYQQTEQEDGGPFTVILNKYRVPYMFSDLKEAEDFSRYWNGQTFSNAGHLIY